MAPGMEVSCPPARAAHSDIAYNGCQDAHRDQRGRAGRGRGAGGGRTLRGRGRADGRGRVGQVVLLGRAVAAGAGGLRLGRRPRGPDQPMTGRGGRRHQPRPGSGPAAAALRLGLRPRLVRGRSSPRGRRDLRDGNTGPVR